MQIFAELNCYQKVQVAGNPTSFKFCKIVT